MQINDTTEHAPKANNVIKLNTAFAAASPDHNEVLVFNAVVNGICFQLPLSAKLRLIPALVNVTGSVPK